MGAPRKPFRWKRVLIDVCTQHDFLDTGAIVPVYPPEMDELVVSMMREWHLREITYCPP